MSTHYVDNKKMYAEILVYKEKAAEAEAAGLPRPRIPEYIGHCFLMIARNLARKPNFYNYPFREDMISDGIENCCTYFNNFDPNRTSNPFAYFTQIIWFAFIRRIQKEKKQLYVKHKLLEHSIVFNEMFDTSSHDAGENQPLINNQTSDKMIDFTVTYENWMETKKRKKERVMDTADYDEQNIHPELEDIESVAGEDILADPWNDSDTETNSESSDN